MKGPGQLKGDFNGEYYQTYAKYYVKFFEEYFKQGINFWAVTIQNEPSSGLIPNYGWQTMFMSYWLQREFANQLLGPALRASPPSQSLKIIAHDDQRIDVVFAALAIFLDPFSTGDYVDGLGVHWYTGREAYAGIGAASRVDSRKFIIATEACNGYNAGEHTPLLGDWDRGEAYGHDIIQTLLNNVTGWTDWNMCLDETGGPTWVGNFVDSPIIVNNTADEFYKQPMFYYMGHFSKFVRPDSLRLKLAIDAGLLHLHTLLQTFEGVVFFRPDNRYAVVLHNRDASSAKTVSIEDASHPGRRLLVQLEPKSISTFIWNRA
ncbi:O-Glycosyl hydrolase family 30 protein [Aphelenchoides avenae]|nr:O-Glycosyl hydrolase family 30 protein [Aphelenchus avenae]